MMMDIDIFDRELGETTLFLIASIHAAVQSKYITLTSDFKHFLSTARPKMH